MAMARAAVCALLVSPAAAGLVGVERVRAPAGWVRGAEVAGAAPLEFTAALRHSAAQREWLADTVRRVSEPSSPQYARHLTLGEVTARMSAPEAAVAEVTDALVAGGIPADGITLLPSGDWLRFEATAGQAGRVFGTTFCEWRHAETAHRLVRACDAAYSLPAAAARHVSFVAGLVHFPALRADGGVRRADAGASGDVATLRATYNVGDVKAASGKASQAFTQFLGQYYGHGSLDKFLTKYAPDQAGQTVAKTVGPDQSGTGTEANLDAQYITAMAHGGATWVWTNQVKNTVNNQEPWVAFFSNVSSAADLPNIFSISYGEGEDTLTPDYIDRSDVELQKIATRGVTMMAASGDNGAGCEDDKFVANFPAALPHITSVGGTKSCEVGSGTASFSSGGFSNLYPRQKWQAEAVAGYLSSGATPAASFFNASGRAYPDVAACGAVKICESVVCGLGVQGTSCASPILAGVLSLVNDARLAAGKAPLGFLNPFLYANAAAFDDVTTGTTQGCSGGKFSATAGWDPTTGLGTPNYQKLVSAALRLQ